MLSAKFAAPNASIPAVKWQVLDRIADPTLTIFNAPPGYLFANVLANRLVEMEKPPIWLRLGAEDRDPATLLLSLIESVRRQHPDFGANTLVQMQRMPGPIAGWSPLYAHLAQELTETLPPSTPIVLEHIHLLAENQPLMGLFGAHLLARIPGAFPCILISHVPFPPDMFPPGSNVLGPEELRIGAQTSLSLAANASMELPKRLIQRALELVDGKAVEMTGLINACRLLGPESIDRLINRARNEKQLLTMVARACLAATGKDDLRALALTMDLDYSHPEMTQAVLGIHTTLTGPWLQPLINDWSRIWSSWKTPLRSTLKLNPYPNVAGIIRTADYMLERNAVEIAVRLFLEAEDYGTASRVISNSAEKMLNLGQWSTLETWLKRLPAEVLYSWPQLVYIQGEMAAANGRTGKARHTFATASRLFSARQNLEGACRSLLAEGTLAAWEGDTDRAQACTLSANAMAQTAGLTWHQAWANWQLGCLAASAERLDEALSFFINGASVVNNALAEEVFHQAEAILQHQRELHNQREYHRRAYLRIEQSEQESKQLLHSLLSSPPEILPALLGNLGWSQTPLTLKLSTPPLPQEAASNEAGANFWRKMLSLFGRLKTAGPADSGFQENDSPALSSHLVINDLDPVEAPIVPAAPLTDSLSLPLPPTQDIDLPEQERLPQDTKPHPDDPTTTDQDFLLTAYMLGTFRLSIENAAMQRWPSARGLAVLKYLLINHEHKIPREVLMDTFWRGSDPDAARNNLNVALHSLRSALREITETPIIIFDKGNYILNPDLQVWLDVDEFENHLRAGKQLEKAGHLAKAIRKYEIAASLYQGDFLEEDPYEEWPVLTRERLRVSFLDTLDRLSQIYFSQGQYAACIALCQQMLERDNCREDAHCLLMRCYNRQGQPHLALRQYQVCIDALRTDLDVDPEPATIQLAERIRHHQAV